MEFCNLGSLDEAIQAGRFYGGLTEGHGHMRVDLQAVCLTLLDIASAMTHLHSMRIVHKDMKPKNVLLASCLVSFQHDNVQIPTVSDRTQSTRVLICTKVESKNVHLTPRLVLSTPRQYI